MLNRMKTNFPCPACGAPVDPAPGKTTLPCPFCGTTVTIPPELRLAEAPPPPLPAPEEPRFDPFAAAEAARFDEEKLEEVNRDQKALTDTLRHTQTVVAGAAGAYALWAGVKRFAPGCLAGLVILCLVGVAGVVGLILLLQNSF